MNKIELNEMLIRERNLLLCFEENDDYLSIIGSAAVFKTGQYFIKATIKDGKLVLNAEEKVNVFDKTSVYFPTLNDAEFRRFLMSYCIIKMVPGVCFKIVDDLDAECHFSFVDMGLSREELEEWIPEHISMPDPDEFESYPIIVGNVETVSDVFYHSTDYNNHFNYLLTEEYLQTRNLINEEYNYLADKLSRADCESLDRLIKTFDILADIIGKYEYRFGMKTGQNYAGSIMETPKGKTRIDWYPEYDEALKRLDPDNDCEDYDDFEEF